MSYLLDTDTVSAIAKERSASARQGHADRAERPLAPAHALAENLTLVTANEREFARVPKLRIENWLR